MHIIIIYWPCDLIIKWVSQRKNKFSSQIWNFWVLRDFFQELLFGSISITTVFSRRKFRQTKDSSSNYPRFQIANLHWSKDVFSHFGDETSDVLRSHWNGKSLCNGPEVKSFWISFSSLLNLIITTISILISICFLLWDPILSPLGQFWISFGKILFDFMF